MKGKASCPVAVSIIISRMGSGKSSFGHGLFQSLKSTHMRVWPFFFLTRTIFAIHVGFLILWMNLASINLLTSASIDGSN